MDVVPSNFMPGDPRLVDQIVYELKSQGIFDQFRKECIADVDTKPAYQNLRQRVEGNVTSFLAKQKWSEDLNKNQLREQLRKHISESGWLERGVERIVDQVVNPKINTVFMPKVEDVYHTFLGIEKPFKEGQAKNEEKNEKQSENLDVINKPGGSGSENMVVDILPNDLEAISPESNKEVSLNDTEEKHDAEPIIADGESQSSSTTAKTEDEESPPFEPLDDVSPSSIKYSPKEEISDDSQESGLTSHDTSFEQKPPTPVDLSLEISQTSCDTKVSSNDSTKMEICETEDEVSLENTEVAQKEEDKINSIQNEKKEDIKKHVESDDKFEKDIKVKSDEKEKRHVEKEKKSDKKDKKSSKHEKDKKDEKRSKDIYSHSKERSSSKHSHSSSKDKEKKSEKESRKDDIKDRDSKKDDATTKENKEKDREHSRDKEKSKDRSHKDKDSHKYDKDKSKSSADKSDKDRSSKDKESSKKDERERHKSSSSKDKDKERTKHDKKETEKDKHKLSREKSSSSIKESPSKSKDSSKKHKDSSRDKDRDNTKDKCEKISKEKDGDKEKSKSTETKKDKSKSDHKEKKLGDGKHKSSDKHKKSDRDKSSDHHKRSSSKKDKDNKSKDDHYSSKEKRHERRSTDRDSNDGSSKSSRNGSFHDGSVSQSGRVGKGSSNRIFDSSTSGDSSGGTYDNVEGHIENSGEYIEEIEVFEHEMVEHEFVNHSDNIVEETVLMEHQSDDVVGEVEIGGQDVEEEVQQSLAEPETVVEAENVVKAVNKIQQPPPIKFIKPKYASNMQEAMRIMKIRKQLVELEKQANSTLQNLTSPNKINVDKNKKTEAQMQKSDNVESSVNLEDIESPVPSIKFIKPKFASNMKEAMRLMKIRKKLAQLEKEHQQALAELRKRRENNAQSELNVEEVELVVPAASPEKKPLESKSAASPRKPETRFIDELPDDEPLLQSIDLSSEKFAELEAKLALEMANIDFSSYDIPSDEEEEYQSIVISPKKPRVETSEDFNKKDDIPVENRTKKSSDDSSNIIKPIKKSVNVKVEKTKKNNKTEKNVSDVKKSNVTQTKDAKIISKLAKISGSVGKKNNAINKLNKNKVKTPIQKAKNKINSKTQNHNDSKLNPMKKLIVISVKQDLCNGFAESKKTDLESTVKELVSNSSLNKPEKKSNLTTKKENSNTNIHNPESVLELKKDNDKVLFVNLTNADHKIKEQEVEQRRRKSLEYTKEMGDCETTPTSTVNTDQAILIDGIEEVQNKLDINKSDVVKNITNAQHEKVGIAISDKNTDIEATNTISHITNKVAPESQIIKWEPEDSPCYYFTPVKENWEKQLSMLNEFISNLENKIEQDSLLISQVIVPKKKVGRKRKILTNTCSTETKPISPDVKRQRLNSAADKKEVNNLMLSDEAGFSLPLSPAQSDEADVKKEEPPVIVAQPKRRTGRASIGKRYDSSDLYKPRPVISRGSSRRSMASDKS